MNPNSKFNLVEDPNKVVMSMTSVIMSSKELTKALGRAPKSAKSKTNSSGYTKFEVYINSAKKPVIWHGVN